MYQNIGIQAEKSAHKNIKNINYRRFLDEGIIKTIDEADITEVIDNIPGIYGRYKEESQALVICTYYTGARPNEILRIRAKDVKKEGSYVKVYVQGSKKGLPRTIFLPYKKPLVKRFWEYVEKVYPEKILFFRFVGRYLHKKQTKKGIVVKIDIAARMYYHFQKWFSILELGGVPPYYLRHNRFSKLSMAGLDMQTLRMIKGSKTFSSIEPYLHLSAKEAQKAARKLD